MAILKHRTLLKHSATVVGYHSSTVVGHRIHSQIGNVWWRHWLSKHFQGIWKTTFLCSYQTSIWKFWCFKHSL